MLKPRYEPLDALVLANFLGQAKEADDPVTVRQKAARVAAQKIAQLLSMAETQPAAWRVLIQFIGEEVRQLTDATAGVDPTADPAKIHGYQCFKAGGAQALVELAMALLPENLEKKLDKLRSMCDNSAKKE